MKPRGGCGWATTTKKGPNDARDASFGPFFGLVVVVEGDVVVSVVAVVVVVEVVVAVVVTSVVVFWWWADGHGGVVRCGHVFTLMCKPGQAIHLRTNK